MTWVKLDDGFCDHPKVLAAGPAAGWLYVAGLCYAGRFLTDGFIPSGVERKLTDLPRPGVLVAKLLDVGLWEEVDGGWWIHDFDRFQRTKAQVDGTRKKGAERQAKLRNERRNGATNAVTNGGVTRPEAEAERDTEEARAKAPSALVAVPSAPAVPQSEYHPEFEAWWSVYPRKVGKKAAQTAWLKAKRRTSADDLLAAATAHAAAWAANGTDPQFIPHPATWLNEGRYDDPPPAPTGPTTKVDRNRVALIKGAQAIAAGAPTFAERIAAAGGPLELESGAK